MNITLDVWSISVSCASTLWIKLYPLLREKLYLQWCSRNIKSHCARNLLANRRTDLTLFVRLGTKSDLLIEQLLIGEHYCT